MSQPDYKLKGIADIVGDALNAYRASTPHADRDVPIQSRLKMAVVEEGVILEHDTRGTLVLNARRLRPKRAAFFSCNYQTEQIATEEGP